MMSPTFLHGWPRHDTECRNYRGDHPARLKEVHQRRRSELHDDMWTKMSDTSHVFCSDPHYACQRARTRATCTEYRQLQRRSLFYTIFGPGNGSQYGHQRCSCWYCCYQICDLLRLFHFITDHRQTSHTHRWQHYPQSHRDGLSS